MLPLSSRSPGERGQGSDGQVVGQLKSAGYRPCFRGLLAQFQQAPTVLLRGWLTFLDMYQNSRGGGSYEGQERPYDDQDGRRRL